MINCNNLYGFLWQMHWDCRRTEPRGDGHYEACSQDNELAPKTRERKETKRQARREWRKTQSSSSRDGGGGEATTTVMRSHNKQEDEEEMKREALSLQENNEQEPLVVDVGGAQHEKPSGNDNQCELPVERFNEVSNNPTCLMSSSG